jgi:hypothetical protein
MGKTKPPAVVQHHPIRTFFAAVFGLIALWLVFASLLLVWVNRTLTDTPTFVSTLTPVLTEPSIQTFITEKATDQILQSVPAPELAVRVLPPAEAAGKTPEQLAPLVRPALLAKLKEFIGSPKSQEIWKSTVESTHTKLTAQLRSGDGDLELDLSPAITGMVDQLKAKPELADVADKIQVPTEAGKLKIAGGSLDQAHKWYNQLQQSTIIVVAATLLAIALSVWLSVHHNKTLRRILMGSGLMALGVAAILQAPSIVPIKSDDPVMRDAVVALSGILFHNLQLACLVLAGVCIAGAIGSKIFEKVRAR